MTRLHHARDHGVERVRYKNPQPHEHDMVVLVSTDDEGRVTERLECVCRECAAYLTPLQAINWLKTNKKKRRFHPGFTCSRTCRGKSLRAPPKSERKEDWARGDGDGLYRGGIDLRGGK